jgi:hypothetical protein
MCRIEDPLVLKPMGVKEEVRTVSATRRCAARGDMICAGSACMMLCMCVYAMSKMLCDLCYLCTCVYASLHAFHNVSRILLLALVGSTQLEMLMFAVALL